MSFSIRDKKISIRWTSFDGRRKDYRISQPKKKMEVEQKELAIRQYNGCLYYLEEDIKAHRREAVELSSILKKLKLQQKYFDRVEKQMRKTEEENSFSGNESSSILGNESPFILGKTDDTSKTMQQLNEELISNLI